MSDLSLCLFFQLTPLGLWCGHDQIPKKDIAVPKPGVASMEPSRGCETKIEMTVPVTCRVQPGTTEYKVSFFVPTKHQNSPPEPTDPDVFIEERKGAAIFVRSFGGFASAEKFSKEAKELADTLKKEGQPFHSDFYYTAGYNSPFRLFNRHNEVWYFKKEEIEGLWLQMAKNFLGKIGKLLV
ncbi:heme-binding protein 2-like isoform X3 [Sminthopsis crassicaudata]|uniref:heme-binding protein 2-like isoform X3 n=1 Tax=Sminthopsis crassicaudata TaxID=9301 RepID=UPI003D691806